MEFNARHPSAFHQQNKGPRGESEENDTHDRRFLKIRALVASTLRSSKDQNTIPATANPPLNQAAKQLGVPLRARQSDR